MPRQFKLARQFNKLKATEAAERLGVAQPTLSAWEGARKSPSLDNLENMADLYGVTTDFLLGRTERSEIPASSLIAHEALAIYHAKPVWSAKYGWLLVNAIDQKLLLPNGQTIPFADSGELYTVPQPFAEPALPFGKPLLLSEVKELEQIWLEPVSSDQYLRNELRGWYHVKKRFVENEYGNRFYLDTYGAKWLAFHMIEL